jgi:integrase
MGRDGRTGIGLLGVVPGRVQRGGFGSEQAAAEALEWVLEQLRREQGLVESPTLAEFVDVDLAQHEGEPETTEKLRWLLAKAVRVWASGASRNSARRRSRRGGRPSGGAPLRSDAGAAPGARAGGQLGTARGQPGQARRREPPAPPHGEVAFESWEQLYALPDKLAPRHRPMVLFAAATGLRPGELLALEHRDIDREAQVVYVRRTLRNGRVKPPKTKASVRAVPQKAAGIAPLRRIYDLRHTFATFALRAGISTFDPPATWAQAWP